MEKFSKWRDAGTGIQPFLQPQPSRSEQQSVKRLFNFTKQYLLGPVIATVRLAALGALALLDTATHAIGSILVVPSVKRAYGQCTRAVIARTALFVMGFYSIDAKTTSLQRGRRNNATSQSAGVQSGDIIVANHVSYLDILYLVWQYNPVFVEIDNATTYMRVITAWSALRGCARQTPALLPAQEARTLKSITQMARVQKLGPVVVFPENATTNGRGLLRLLPVFEDAEQLDEKSIIHLVAFKYPFQSFSPSYSVGNQMAHLIQLCCQIYNQLVVRRLDQREAPKVGDSALFCDSGAEPVDLDEKTRELLVGVSRLRMVGLSAMDKRDFLAFYYKRAGEYKH